MGETVEGQELAQQILADPGGSAWTEFHFRYEPILLARARSLWSANAFLRADGTPEDLVQQFLAEQVIPPERQPIMFGPSALGRRHLRPWMLACLKNFSVSRTRRLAVRSQLLPARGGDDLIDAGTSGPPAAEEYGTARERVERHVAAQLAAIREAFARRQETPTPFLHLLLLRERLDLLVPIAASVAGADRCWPEGWTPDGEAEQLAPWTRKEESRPLPTRLRLLGDVWSVLAKDRSPYRLPVEAVEIADALGVSTNHWFVWCRRARRTVRDHHGPDATRVLFPHWPNLSDERSSGRCS